MCLQYKSKEPQDKSKHYKGMGDAFYKIVKHEGIWGLYKVFFRAHFTEIISEYYVRDLFQGFVV